MLMDKDEIIFSKLFTQVSRARKASFQEDEIERSIAEEYDDLSKRLDRSKIQESGAVRGLLRARNIAILLIDEKGNLDLKKIEIAIEALKRHLYFLGTLRIEDALRQKHMLTALEYLLKCQTTQKLIKQFSRPESHPGAEKVIRETLDIPSNTVLTDALVRQAALSAWLTYLRQSVGSCFATAPAILIQTEQADQFLMDLKEMLDTGRLKRVANGVEIHAPISTSWGVGDLRKPILVESENENSFRDIGYQPGILAGLVEAGIIEGKNPLKEKIIQSRDLVRKALKRTEKSGLYFVTTAENIFKSILLEHFEINEQILRDYLSRPREMVFGGLMLQMPHASRGQRGTGELCAQFLEAFEEAKSAFKRLAENALLKTWEFTVASFSETKSDFTKWNMYVSLGMDAKEQNGIGYSLYEAIKDRLDRANQKVQEYQQEYEALYSQLIFAEGRVKSATTEKEIRWLKAEYQSRYNEFQTFEIIRNREHARAQRLSNLYNDLIRHYMNLFPRYFQEVYDAEVHEVLHGIWDDRPAGFRLLFKHGRMNTAQWSRIDTPQQYSDALASFFSMTESEISHSDDFEGLEQDISDMVTRVINHVKTKDFLESAIWRMAARYNEPLLKNPLEHLDSISKKPWAYTSGGNIYSLITGYFNLKESPTQVERFVENEMELLVFIIDSLKLLSHKVTDPYLTSADKKMLMFSPTHAFNLKPGLSEFKSTWENQSFTFTWVRDELVYPMQSYWESYVFTRERYEVIIQAIVPKIPLNFQPRFKELFNEFPGEMSPSDMAGLIYDKASFDRGLMAQGRPLLEKHVIDEIFFNNLPIMRGEDIKDRAEEVLKSLPEFKESWLINLDSLSGELTARDIIDYFAAVVLKETNQTSFSDDYMNLIVKAARLQKILPPAPIIFADTNWTNYYFSFLVSPATGLLELWRTDRLGLKGAPMSEWKIWLNGSKRDPKWGMLTNPYEYKK